MRDDERRPRWLHPVDSGEAVARQEAPLAPLVEPHAARTYRAGAGTNVRGRAPQLTVGDLRRFLLALELDDVPNDAPLFGVTRGFARPRLAGLEVELGPDTAA